MGITGTDVAKETADMVLTDDNYASIVSAIEQGRIIYSNIRKFVYYLISCNIAEIMIIFLSTLFTGKSPLTAIQLLWLNLVTDGAPALAASPMKPVTPTSWINSPDRRRNRSLTNICAAGSLCKRCHHHCCSARLFHWSACPPRVCPSSPRRWHLRPLSISELLRGYTSRSEYYPVLKIGLFKNKWMNIGVLASMVLIFLVIYVPFLNKLFDTVPLGWASGS